MRETGRKTRTLRAVPYRSAGRAYRWSAASRWRGRVLAGIVLAVLLAAGIKGWRIYSAAQALLADARALDAQARALPGAASLATLGPLLAQAHADAAALRAESAPFFPLTRRLGWAPVVGGDLAAAEPLLDTAVELSGAADESVAALAPLLRDGQPAEALIRKLPQIQPQLASARGAADRAAAAWSRVQLDTLSPRIRAQFQRLDVVVPLAQASLGAAPILPALAEDLRALEAFTQAKLDPAAFERLQPLLRKTHSDLILLRDAAAPLFPAAAQLRSVPGYGADLAVAQPLLDAAVGLSRAADESVAALAPIVRPAGGAAAAPLAGRLLAARPQIERARGAAVEASALWARVPLATLSPALHERLRGVVPLLAQTQKALDLALIAPDLLGASGRREYLLLAQNPDELRATGGFISGVGALTIANSRVDDFALENSPTVDNFKTIVYPVPPRPLRQYMGIEQWVLRDANWSPDFPTAARNAAYLYQLTQGRAVADVLAFEPAAVQLLLGAIGPVSVDDFPEPVSADNLPAYMRSQYNQQFQTDRKAFLETLGRAIIAKLESAPGQLDALALARAAERALDERHLLIAAGDPTTAAVLRRRGWDGAVQPGDADFLMVVDSNVGYNKVNPNIRQDLTYSVDLRDPAQPRAELAVHHANPTTSAGECRQSQGELIGPNWYEQRLVGCYWDYLRVLTPAGSRLIGADTQPTPGKWMLSGFSDDGAVAQFEGEAGATTFGALVVVPSNAERTTVVRYRLPEAVVTRDEPGWRYRLRVQKQPGRPLQSCTVSVRLPRQAELLASSAAPTRQPDGTLRFALDLTTDQEIEITFRAGGS
jgi:hypothetical protein